LPSASLPCCPLGACQGTCCIVDHAKIAKPTCGGSGKLATVIVAPADYARERIST
jgi:hypothetical protein